MILCGAAGIVCLLILAFWRRHPVMEKIRTPCRVIVVFCVLGSLAELTAQTGSNRLELGEITRREPGEGDREEEAIVYLKEEDTEYPITLTIEERQYPKAEEEKLLAGAKKEIRETFCGDNASLDQITANPVVLEGYQNDAVSAEWLFSKEEVISPEGDINQKALGENPEEIEAVISLSCGEAEEWYRFSFTVIPEEKTRKDRLVAAIQDRIQKQDRKEAVVKLPDQINGQAIIWREGTEVETTELFGLGILAAAAAVYVEKEQKERKKQKRRQNLLAGYPEFVSKISLLLGAGMTISSALRKINQMHQQKMPKENGRDAVYEELYQMICKIDNGMGEMRAYQEFARQCEIRPYRRLVSLLISGQRTGSQKLLEQLNEESERVFSERKNTARKFGEEAGTKMLLPMMMMLVIVMGIVIIPAFLSIYGG